MKICIEREPSDDKQTLGLGYVYNETGRLLFAFKTLELAWRDNERRVSCIPEGTYRAIRHTSPKFGPCLWIQNVPNRSEILIHPGNFHSQILGCILPGENHIDINADGYKDVTSSRKTMKKLLNLVPNEIEISIEWKQSPIS